MGKQRSAAIARKLLAFKINEKKVLRVGEPFKDVFLNAAERLFFCSNPGVKSQRFKSLCYSVGGFSLTSLFTLPTADKDASPQVFSISSHFGCHNKHRMRSR